MHDLRAITLPIIGIHSLIMPLPLLPLTIKRFALNSLQLLLVLLYLLQVDEGNNAHDDYGGEEAQGRAQ